jgi:hypothetical protein
MVKQQKRKRAPATNCLLVIAIVSILASVISLGYFRKVSRSNRRKHNLSQQPCIELTHVFRTGSCEKFMTYVHKCDLDDHSEWFFEMREAIIKGSGSLGKSKLRELKLKNGKSIDEDSPVPHAVYALFDKELFVFPTCELGAEYLVELTSAKTQVNLTGLNRRSP